MKLASYVQIIVKQNKSEYEMKIFVIILKKYSFKWNEKIFIRFLTNKKEMYSNQYFHSFFIHLFEY